MPPDLPVGADLVVAYQGVVLADLRATFDRLDFDFADALIKESELDGQADDLEVRLAVARATILAAGGAIPPSVLDTDVEEPRAETRPDAPPVREALSYEELVALSAQRLSDLGVRLDRDPLVQVLPAPEIEDAIAEYAARHGDTDWTAADWSTVLLAGVVGTLLDVLVVRSPEASSLLGHALPASPLTTWLREGDLAGAIRERYLDPLAESAHIPADAAVDAATGYVVRGLRPKVHRLMSFAHDPLLGFVIGIADLMNGTGTYVDKFGHIQHVATSMAHDDLVHAFGKELAHLLTDVATPAGIQPPGFTLVQLVPGTSPFRLAEGGAKVPWVDVARWMYVHHYDMRHFFVSGLTPGAVMAIILTAAVAEAQIQQRPLSMEKVASMLVVGNAIALSGSLLKTTVLFGMNPLAFNWAQLLAMGPVTLAWLAISASRERRIRADLDKEWATLAAWGQE